MITCDDNKPLISQFSTTITHVTTTMTTTISTTTTTTTTMHDSAENHDGNPPSKGCFSLLILL